MRAFKTKSFTRFARSANISDRALLEAMDRARRGLVDADLGGGILKQRVARKGQGRSSGHRVLIAYGPKVRSVSSTAFPRTRVKIYDDELATLRDIAQGWFGASPAQISEALTKGLIEEVQG